jgi:hypothetical protein
MEQATATATTTAADWPVPLVRLPGMTGEPFDAIFDMETNDPDDYLTLYTTLFVFYFYFFI